MISYLISLLSPHIAYAQTSDFDTFISHVDSLIINPLILLLFGLAVAYFLYGLVQFIANQDSEEKRTAGKSHMIYGVIGMTIMMSVFAVMNMVLNTLNVNGIDPEKGSVQLDNYNPQWP